MGILKTGANFVGGTAEYGVKDGLRGVLYGAVIAGAVGAVALGGIVAIGAYALGYGLTLGVAATVASFASLGGILGAVKGAFEGGVIGAGIGILRGGAKKVGEQSEEKAQDLSLETEKLRQENLQLAASQAARGKNVNAADAASRSAAFGSFNNEDAKSGHLANLVSAPKPEAGKAIG